MIEIRIFPKPLLTPVLILCIGGSAFGQLEITNFAVSSTGTCALSWTHVTNNYIVQQNTSLLTGTWRYVDQVIATNLNTVSNTYDSEFYRIRKVRVLNFSDSNFVKVICSNLAVKHSPTNQLYDIDVETITNLAISSSLVSNLTGIAEFTNLRSLYCDGNELHNLDLTGCTKLNTLRCGGNYLTNINLTGCTNLYDLTCSGNQLTNLDMSGYVNLYWLYCGGNYLTNLNLTGCTNLFLLFCNNNQLANLDVSGYANLYWLQCDGNLLTNLDMSSCTNLDTLFCGENYLTNINLTGCTNLWALNCNLNQLTTLNLMGYPTLFNLVCSRNSLTGVLDVSTCPNLDTVFAISNMLTVIKVWNTNNLPSTFMYDAGVIITNGP